LKFIEKLKSIEEHIDKKAGNRFLLRNFLCFIRSIIDFIILGFGYHAAAISFYTLMSFLPLIVVLTVVISVTVNLQEEFIRKILSEFFPTKAQTFFDYTVKLTSGSLVFGIFNFILSFYFAGNIFTTLHDALNNIFEVRATSIKRVTLIRVLGIPILIFVLLFIHIINTLITVSLNLIKNSYIWNYIVSNLSKYNLEFIIIVFEATPLIIHPIAYFILVFAIYNFLTPYNDFGKKNLIFVSLLIAMLLSALKFGFDKYIVMVSKTNPIYGSLSGIFAFLAWLYLSYGIILIGGRTLFYIRNHEILKAGL